MNLLDQHIRESLERSLSSEEIQKKIQAAADKLVESAVGNALSTYGPVAKLVEEKLTQAMPQAIDAERLAVFGQTVADIIKVKLADLSDTHATQQINQIMDRLLGAHKTVFTLEDLADAFREKYRHKDKTGSRFTMEVEEVSSSNLDGYWGVALDEKPGVSEYSARYRLRCRQLEKQSIYTHPSEVWSVYVAGEPLKHSLFGGPLFGFDVMIFRLAVGTAKLKCSEFHTYWNKDEYID